MYCSPSDTDKNYKSSVIGKIKNEILSVFSGYISLYTVNYIL